MIYNPEEPYVIASGQKAGKAVDLLMFQDFHYLYRLLKKMNDGKPVRKNRLHEHLEWLMERADTRPVKMICPCCRKKPAKYFSVLGSSSGEFSMSHTFTCCEDDGCRKHLASQAAGNAPDFLPLNFFSILKFSSSYYQKKVVEVLRTAYGLPKRISSQIAFNFFAE